MYTLPPKITWWDKAGVHSQVFSSHERAETFRKLLRVLRKDYVLCY